MYNKNIPKSHFLLKWAWPGRGQKINFFKIKFLQHILYSNPDILRSAHRIYQKVVSFWHTLIYSAFTAWKRANIATQRRDDLCLCIKWERDDNFVIKFDGQSENQTTTLQVSYIMVIVKWGYSTSSWYQLLCNNTNFVPAEESVRRRTLQIIYKEQCSTTNERARLTNLRGLISYMHVWNCAAS